MTNMNQNENVADLFSSAANDQNALKKLFHAYKYSMYNEAMLYLNDEQASKDIAVQAFMSARHSIAFANPDDPKAWFNQFVQEECISKILPLKTSGRTDYTDTDEIASPTAVIPSSNSECRNRLINALKALTPSQRLVAVMYFRDRLNIPEIARRLKSDENTVKSVLTDGKRTIKASNMNLSALIAIVNKLFPVIEEEPELDLESLTQTVKSSPLEYTNVLNEDIEFTTSVLELKKFFNQQKGTRRHYSDHGIDEEEIFGDEPESNAADNQTTLNNDDAEATKKTPVVRPSELTSARHIQNNNSYYEDEDEDDAEEDIFSRFPKWLIYVLILVLIAVLGFTGAYLFSEINNRRALPENTPAATEQSEETETDNHGADEGSEEQTEETAEPEPTPEEPEVLGTAYINVTDLNMRTGPGLSYDYNGTAVPESTYDVLDISEADGYTWYQVSEDQWVPDLAGQYVSFTENN